MKILGIESSCDETAAAVVEDGAHILSDRVASQIEIHARYGGVVPEVASRQHILAIVPVIRQAMSDAGVFWSQLDAIAVTNGPGLAGSLLVGVNVAKSIALAHSLPLIGVNHLEGHIYANWLALSERSESNGLSPAPLPFVKEGDGGWILSDFPLVCLIVSGGHSDLVLMKGHGDYTMLGRTRDDAAGEAFDKAARILGLGYPGGPVIQKAAEAGKPTIKLPHAWLAGTEDFSFSGIKTALLRLAESGKIKNKADGAASFQEAVVEVLVGKTIAAAREHGVKQILVAGGVAANARLGGRLLAESPLPVLIPPLKLCTDNAAMIAACGYYRFRAGKLAGLDLDVAPGLKLA